MLFVLTANAHGRRPWPLATVALIAAMTRQAAAEPEAAPSSDMERTPNGPPSMAPPRAPTTPITTSLPLPSPPKFPRHFLFGNGLALLLTSLSVGYEFLPVPHHSVGVNIHGQYGGGIISEIVGVKGAFIGVGGELGYRFYGWRDGPYGPFIGTSFLMGVYHTQATIYRIDPEAFRYVQYGPALDVGWSVHLDRTTVLALSLGAQYTFVDVDASRLPDLTRLLVGDGPRPRGGVQVGKTF